VIEVFLLAGGVDAQEIVVVGDLVHQHIVDKSAVHVEQTRVVDLARLEASGGISGDVIGELQGLGTGDVMSISPMWLTSNATTLRRTVRCSSTSEEYWTGMSQPPKPTILALIERWAAFRQLAFRAAVAGIKLVL
jgi:hypothetical protein